MKTTRWMTICEAHIVMQTARQFQDYYECGTANGWSAVWPAMVGCRVITFDPVDRPKFWDLEEFAEERSRITFVNRRWHPNVESYVDLSRTRCCLIDGNHKANFVRKDLKAAVELFDTIIVHDANDRAVYDELMVLPAEYHKIVIPTLRGVGIAYKEQLQWMLPRERKNA
jgi:hypothetical protein